MADSIRYFTKSLLAKANGIAVKRGYNRALMDGVVDRLSDGLKYPVCHHMMHSHKGGKACEPHVRVVLATDASGSLCILDCDWNLFYKLPVVEMP